MGKRSSTNLRFDFSPKIEVHPDSRIELNVNKKNVNNEEDDNQDLLRADVSKYKKQSTLGIKQTTKGKNLPRLSIFHSSLFKIAI